MAITSDRLKVLTKQRMELIREIDKSPENAELKSRISLLNVELSLERQNLIFGDKKESAIKAMPELPGNDVRVLERLEDNSGVGSKEIKPARKAGKSSDGNISKKLSDFF